MKGTEPKRSIGRILRDQSNSRSQAKNPPSLKPELNYKNNLRHCGASEATLSPIAVTATASTTAATATTCRPFFTRTGFIDCQGTALEVFLMEHGYGLARVFLRSHFDKREATRPPGRSVLHDIDCDHSACLCKMILQIVFCCGER